MSNDLAIFEKSLALGSLSSYIHWTNQLPMLTEEEEKELTLKLKHQNDLEAARKLVLSHLRLVVKIARGYDGYGLQQADLIQEGNIGLMKAVKRFDPSVGVRLMTYALHWIRAEIHEFVIKNWRIVKIATTKSQRKLFFNLRKFAKSNQLTQSEIELISSELKVSAKDVKQMAQRMSSHDQAFDTPSASNHDDDISVSPALYLEDKESNPESQLANMNEKISQQQKLSTALSQLDPRARDIIQDRWLSEKKSTLQELAKKHRVSAERVRQLEQNAIKSLKLRISE